MRLHRLELAGFGPFRGRQTVDFDAYADDGIFLIAGRTGAGKSSILDGVCFALFGGVPRYSGGERRLRSDHCERDEVTEVSLEFSVSGRRLRVSRSPEYTRPKRRGDGVTVEGHRALLDEFVDGVWTGVAARPTDVARELHEIVGLTQEQFLQVVLLAQNRFADFLHASNDDRRGVLQTLFETRRYQDYAAALEARRKTAETALAERSGEAMRLIDEILRTADVVPVSDDLGAALEASSLVVARAVYRVDTAGVARDAADLAFRAAESEHRDLEARAERIAARGRSRSALAALEAGEPAIALDRERLARAFDAEELRPALSAAERSATAEMRAVRDRVRALAALPEPADAVDAVAILDELSGSLTTWRAASAGEVELADLEAERKRVVRHLAAEERADAELAAQRDALPARLADLDTRLAADRLVAGTTATTAATVVDLVDRLAAARDAVRLGAVRTDAEGALADALDGVAAATAALTLLLRRRLAGYAGELAQGLVDGEPCTVCGADEHPAPAAMPEVVVTDADLAAAEAVEDAASARQGAAAVVAREAREAHARAAERSGGAEPADLDAQLRVARAAKADADAAARRVAADTAMRADLVRLAAEVDAERAAIAVELVAVRDRLARLDERRDAGIAAIADARGPFDTVAARIRATEQRRDAVRVLIAAIADEARAADAAQADRHALGGLVTASRFSDASEAADALLDRDARSTLAEELAAHDLAVRVERERLLELELELADTPCEVDLAGAAARRGAARDSWTTAIGEALRAAQDAERLRDLLGRATAAHAGVADMAADAATVSRLAHTLAGRAPNTRRMDLETFVLAAELEEIVQAANLRLAEMSSGRFQLAHTDALAARGAASGLGLEVVDAFTGRARPTASLSGGETFLASLSLALGLAEVVTARAGGMRLDTLFVDEGFGHLDGETLDLAMRTLDELRQGGRTVGVISHVEAMKEQLTAQLHVEALPGGSSAIRQDAPIVAGA